MKVRDILVELCKQYYRYKGVGCSHQFDQALSELRELLPKKDNYSKGLVEKIGSLSMSAFGLKEGFEDYKKLKEIEKQRNVGYNQAISDMEGVFEWLPYSVQNVR